MRPGGVDEECVSLCHTRNGCQRLGHTDPAGEQGGLPHARRVLVLWPSQTLTFGEPSG